MYTYHFVLTEESCDAGMFGDCSSQCGQCKGDLCNSQTGICTSGCEPGYQGDMCTESKSIIILVLCLSMENGIKLGKLWPKLTMAHRCGDVGPRVHHNSVIFSKLLLM